MIFVWIDSNTVQCDAGFTVQAVHIHDVKYTDDNRSVTIPGEILVGSPSYVLYASQLRKWDVPFEEAQMDETQKRLIVDNVQEALRFMKVDFVVE